MTDLDALESRAKIAMIVAAIGIGLSIGCPIFVLGAWFGSFMGWRVNRALKDVSQPTNGLATTAIWVGLVGSIPVLIFGISISIVMYRAYRGDFVPQ